LTQVRLGIKSVKDIICEQAFQGEQGLVRECKQQPNSSQFSGSHAPAWEPMRCSQYRTLARPDWIPTLASGNQNQKYCANMPVNQKKR
jgi:hypothetical protein